MTCTCTDDVDIVDNDEHASFMQGHRGIDVTCTCTDDVAIVDNDEHASFIQDRMLEAFHTMTAEEKESMLDSMKEEHKEALNKQLAEYVEKKEQ